MARWYRRRRAERRVGGKNWCSANRYCVLRRGDADRAGGGRRKPTARYGWKHRKPRWGESGRTAEAERSAVEWRDMREELTAAAP